MPIIKSINNIKSNNDSAKIRIFSFKKYVKELIKMKKDEKNIDQKKFMDLLIKEIDDPPQYDIILSLSDLYMTIRLIINSLIGVPLYSNNTYQLTQQIKKELEMLDNKFKGKKQELIGTQMRQINIVENANKDRAMEGSNKLTQMALKNKKESETLGN